MFCLDAAPMSNKTGIVKSLTIASTRDKIRCIALYGSDRAEFDLDVMYRYCENSRFVDLEVRPLLDASDMSQVRTLGEFLSAAREITAYDASQLLRSSFIHRRGKSITMDVSVPSGAFRWFVQTNHEGGLQIFAVGSSSKESDTSFNVYVAYEQVTSLVDGVHFDYRPLIVFEGFVGAATSFAVARVLPVENSSSISAHTKRRLAAQAAKAVNEALDLLQSTKDVKSNYKQAIERASDGEQKLLVDLADEAQSDFEMFLFHIAGYSGYLGVWFKDTSKAAACIAQYLRCKLQLEKLCSQADLTLDPTTLQYMDSGFRYVDGASGTHEFWRSVFSLQFELCSQAVFESYVNIITYPFRNTSFREQGLPVAFERFLIDNSANNVIGTLPVENWTRPMVDCVKRDGTMSGNFKVSYDGRYLTGPIWATHRRTDRQIYHLVYAHMVHGQYIVELIVSLPQTLPLTPVRDTPGAASVLQLTERWFTVIVRDKRTTHRRVLAVGTIADIAKHIQVLPYHDVNSSALAIESINMGGLVHALFTETGGNDDEEDEKGEI